MQVVRGDYWDLGAHNTANHGHHDTLGIVFVIGSRRTMITNIYSVNRHRGTQRSFSLLYKFFPDFVTGWPARWRTNHD